MQDINIELSEPCDQHANIANLILHALPKWFGIEKAIIDYCEAVKQLPMIVIDQQGKPLGFCALKTHYQINCELYVLGILPQFHRLGLGSKMIQLAEGYCREHQIKYLTVKTLSERSQAPHYDQTRRFYLKNGFQPFEELLDLWDEHNPCLSMIKLIDL